MNSVRALWRYRVAGFTLVELLLAMAIIGTLASMALPIFRGLSEKAQFTEAISDLKLIESEILAFQATNRVLPPDLSAIGRAGMLDPWGNRYEYLPFPVDVSGGTKGKGGKPPKDARKDKFLHPVNADFDLYSKGADGSSTAPFTAKASRDDVVRAGNGMFFGLAEEF